MNKSEFFGEQFIYNEDQETFNHEYVFSRDGIISSITRECLEEVIKGGLREVIKKNAKSHEHRMRAGPTERTRVIPKLQELRMLKKLGEGEFGKVFLVGAVKELYALKVIDKIKIK